MQLNQKNLVFFLKTWQHVTKSLTISTGRKKIFKWPAWEFISFPKRSESKKNKFPFLFFLCVQINGWWWSSGWTTCNSWQKNKPASYLKKKRQKVSKLTSIWNASIICCVGTNWRMNKRVDGVEGNVVIFCYSFPIFPGMKDEGSFDFSSRKTT